MKKTLYVLTCALCTLLVLPAAAQVPSYVPTDGLVGWWPFNGNANDESGNGNDGVVNGATLTEDRNSLPNGAYDFSNSTYISLPVSTTFLLQEYSISLWFNVNNYSSSYPHLLWGFNNQGTANGYSFDLYLNTLPQIVQFYMESQPTVTGPILSSSPFQISPNTHYHLLINKTELSTEMYINGNFINSDAPINPTIISDSIFVGLNGGTYSGFDGQIDDIAIHNRALTLEEVQALYTSEPAAPITDCTSLPSNLQQGLVGYWPFCGNANDESGNGNDGVVNGATLTEDRFGNEGAAYSFDGVNDVITYPNLEHVNLTTFEGVTMSAWFNTLDLGLNQRLMHFYSINNDLSIHYSTSQGSLYFINYIFPQGEIYTHNTTITPGEWHHAAWAIDFSSNISSAYIDGELIGTQNTIPTLIDSDMSFRVGNGPTLENWPFYGPIDDVVIHNRALTPEEVQELFTLDACTFTVYDTLTVYETVYDTVYTYETIYDTVTTYVTVTDTLLIDITFVGFEGQPSWLNTVTVFPNPASDHITIDYGNFALMAGYNTIITDAAGATVYSSAVNSQQVEIDINAWGATGVYYMSVYDASGQLVAVRHIVLE